MRSLERRILDVEVAIYAYKYSERTGGRDNEELVIDLLADLQHYCDSKDLDYVALETLATTHYLAETD